MRFRFLICTLGLAALALSCGRTAPDGAPAGAEDPYRYTGLYHPYAPLSLEDTPAPKGYKAFYLSHYGRHGSRFVEYASVIGIALSVLENAELTPAGERLRDSLRAEYKFSDGLWGMLTERGGEEHEAIGARMARRFPDIFSGGRRRLVHCMASMKHRCIISMVHSTDGIQSVAPGLVFDYATGDRYMPHIMNKESYPKGMRDSNSVINNDFRSSRLDFDAIFRRWFVDPSVVKLPHDFVFSLYQSWLQQVCIRRTFVDLYEYLTPEEIEVCWRASAGIVWMNHGQNPTWSERRLPADWPILTHVLEHADSALADGRTAADLRYGHDIGLLPLVCLMHLDGYDQPRDYAYAAEHWDIDRELCMASNLQLVFYAPKRLLRSGDALPAEEVLVKALYNERETAIPALTPVSGPYYRWSDVRAYWYRQIK